MYKIILRKSAEKSLRKIPQKDHDNILEKLERLANGDENLDTKVLVGPEKMCRMRVGNYRVVYSIVELEVYIDVIEIGHRKDVYKNI